ncbi:MAG: c-type cytochrome [Planctomycetes bacterium]|nr:c-type cytochrome [Planctomycetota bacterium]
MIHAPMGRAVFLGLVLWLCACAVDAPSSAASEGPALSPVPTAVTPTPRAPDSEAAADLPPVTSTAAAPQASTEPMADEQADEDEVTGRSLYVRHCAGCHNENGDGRGKTMLDQGKQARSFAQGGFAFGNTPEAIFNTITAGIPGSSLMQSFQAVMDDDERRLVAEYVISLTPTPSAQPASGSVMVVADRAVFARGKLPALGEGLPERPRGLLVGLPGGLSFEYRVDRGRLLCVRQGPFADRTDWNERGGGVLKPLGTPVFRDGDGDPAPWLYAALGQQQVPIELALAGTRVAGARGELATIHWRPLPETGPGIVAIEETLEAPTLAEAECFRRTLAITRTPESPLLILWLGSWPDDALQRDPRVTEFGERESPWFVLKREGGFDCLLVEGNALGATFSPPLKGMLRLGMTFESSAQLSARGADPVARIRLVQVRVKQWDEALLRRLAEELSR